MRCLNNTNALSSSTYENGILSKQCQPLPGQLSIAQSHRSIDIMTTPTVNFLGTIMERRQGTYRIRPDPGVHGEAPDVYALWPEVDVLLLVARVEFVHSGLPTFNYSGGSYLVTMLRVLSVSGSLYMSLARNSIRVFATCTTLTAMTELANHPNITALALDPASLSEVDERAHAEPRDQVDVDDLATFFCDLHAGTHSCR